jgi:hypothetical protein
MKLSVLLFSICLALPICVNGMETHSSYVETSVPGLLVNSLTHDFEDVYLGKSESVNFELYNNSATPVSISRIRSDCGCRAALENDAPLAPGDRKILTVICEPDYHTGSFTKTITVYTDSEGADGLFHWFELQLTGRILSVFSLDPWHVYFSRVIKGQSAEANVTVRSIENQDASIQTVISDSEHLEVSLEHKPDDDSKTWFVTLRLLESAPAGAFSETVTLQTTHPIQDNITLKVYAWVRGPVSVSPTQFYLGTLVPGDVIEKTFSVEKSGEPADLQPPVLSSAPDWLTYSIETIQENRQYNVNITVSVPENLTGRLSSTITIETNDLSNPRFEIPIFGYVLSDDMQTTDLSKNQPADQMNTNTGEN